MTAFTFSNNQSVAAQGDIASTNALDLQASNAPSVDGLCIELRGADDAGWGFASKGNLQLFLQSSRDGAAWGMYRPLTPVLNVSSIAAKQVLARHLVPPLATDVRWLRLAYRVSGATPSGKLTAVLTEPPPDRFNYKPGAVDWVGA